MNKVIDINKNKESNLDILKRAFPKVAFDKEFFEVHAEIADGIYNDIQAGNQYIISAIVNFSKPLALLAERIRQKREIHKDELTEAITVIACLMAIRELDKERIESARTD